MSGKTSAEINNRPVIGILTLPLSNWLGNNITLAPSLMYTMMKADGETLGTNLDVRVGFGIYF